MITIRTVKPLSSRSRDIIAAIVFAVLLQSGVTLTNHTFAAAPSSPAPQNERLWIFYNDTATYDATARIDTCSGIRVPVVIRASSNGTSISTDRSTPFTITLSSGLVAYAGSTTSVKITVASLVNGTVTIWITSTGGNVVNGTLQVTSNEITVASGERNKINFKACYPTPRRGAYFATNGRGAVDLAKVYYERPLEITEIPDSIVFYWPGTAGQVRIAKKQDIVQDTIDRRVLNITLPQSFSYGITRYTQSGSMLGIACWSNPLVIDVKTTLKFPFDIADSVGPILTSATLIERLVAGNDSLILTFSETVQWASVVENSLTLLKKKTDGSFVPVLLQIIKTEFTIDSAIAITIKNTGEDGAPKEGDSLRITPTGPIVDASGNKAHPLNCPVAITTKEVAPDIVSARYEDRNADGTIETVQIVFNKAVSPGEMTMQFSFEQNSSLKADSTRFTVVNPTTVDVHIEGMFSESYMKNKTSGIFYITIIFTNYTENNKKNRKAVDGAAPVLTAVEYHQGNYFMIGRDLYFDSDTIFATFSEQIEELPPLSGYPFTFQDSTGKQFIIATHYLSVRREFHVFLVDSTPSSYSELDRSSTKTPNDSAWINIEVLDSYKNTDITDLTYNVQKNPSNKRVPVQLWLRYVPVIINTPTTQTDEPPPKSCGCGSGTGLALIPPLFYYSRRKFKNRSIR